MSTPFKQSEKVISKCLACGGHHLLSSLKQSVCIQCWGWSAIGHSIEYIQKLLKQGEQR